MRGKLAGLVIGASLGCYAAADEAPSADLLEFLGNGAQVDEQWIDPLSLHESPETFAAVSTADKDTGQRNVSGHREGGQAAADGASPSHNEDGGNKDD